MKSTKVVPIQTGMSQAFLLIQGNTFGLVDSGDRNTEKRIVKAIISRGLKMENLQFIFLTHTHYDHAGNAATLKEMSNAKIIVHQSEADYLRKGFHPIPNGSNPLFRAVVFLGRKFAHKAYSAFMAVEPDILFESRFDFQPFGFDAEIIHTPGHTSGSSVLVADRKAFAGDTIFNVMGFNYPFFVNDETALKKSWEQLLDLDVDFYCPAHGKRIQKAEFIEAFRKKYST
jgi:glyoxylase-like metal-dependent hydrolase (beta-lactamase superfamily II)